MNLVFRFEWVRPETSSLWASLHEQPWKLQVLLSQWLHLNAWWILCQWVILMSCLLSINTKQIKLQSFHICICYLFVDSRTCSLAHCQYGCEEVQGEIRCLCPSAGLQLGQDERTCVGEKPHSQWLKCIWGRVKKIIVKYDTQLEAGLSKRSAII